MLEKIRQAKEQYIRGHISKLHTFCIKSGTLYRCSGYVVRKFTQTGSPTVKDSYRAF